VTAKRAADTVKLRQRPVGGGDSYGGVSFLAIANPVEPGERIAPLRGLKVDPELFERELVVRAVTGAELAHAAGLGEAAVTKLRRGQRVDRDTLLLISAALDAIPIIPSLARMAGYEVEPKPRRKGAATR
jgi:DNA-binding Xre family transcriptional regulator